MRKLAALFAVLMLCIASVYSQTKTVTGRVTDANGDPVPYATIKIKGANTGVAADQNGNFSIEVNPKATLTISAAGFEEQDIAVSDRSTLTINLQPSANMQEVVVTALGIKRNKNTLPYAAQQVKGDEVSKLRTGNAAAALSGKVSGVQIIQGNGIGGSTNIVVRGMKSLQSNNQALFVVDGVPVDNSTYNTSNQRTGRGGYDYGNAAADINPDDIDNISVLKGAAATALYGSRAANGVIMISTKKGKKGLGISVNTGVRVGQIDKNTFAKYQDQYGAGYSANYSGTSSPNRLFWYFDANGDGVDDLVVPTSEDASYGAKFDPSLMVYHWDAFDPASPYYKTAKPWVAATYTPADFYETAVSTNNNVVLTGGTDRGTIKLAYTRDDEKGVLPNSRVLKNTINFGATYNITPKLIATASANYSKIDGKGRYGTGYSGRNVNQNFRQWYQRNVDIKEQKEAYFRNRQNITWNWKDPSTEAGTVPIYTDNYYWTLYENYEKDTRSRIFGNVQLDYKITDWLSILGRATLDSYTQFMDERIAVGSQGTPGYTRYDLSFSERNYDLLANFDKNIGADFNVKALVGTNRRRSTYTYLGQATSGGLIVPGLYSIANSKGTVPNPTEYYQPKAVDGYFGGLTLGYKETLILDGTFRRDRSSTLPENSNAYNYYAVSAGWIFSKHLSQLNWLSYGKVRLNYAEVGNDAAWGALRDTYDQPTPFGSTILFSVPGTKNNENLVPERTKSREIGLEAAFLNNRLGFDITYYKTNTHNQIIPVSVSTATGYNSKYVNAGNIENKGIELSVFVTPVKTRDFSWNINLNWTKNTNKVVELFKDESGNEITNIQLGSFQGGVSINATVGQPYGTIQGKTYMMIDPKDASSLIVWDGVSPRVVNASGFYRTTTTTTNVFGSYNPEWIGGIYNTFKYKNFSLGFLIDARKGGKVWSLDMYYGLNYTGIYPESAGLNENGKSIRTTDDGGGVILDGVLADGSKNTKRVALDANQAGFAASDFAYDASYVKLREAVLTYSFPQGLFKNASVIKGVDFSIIGRNLWIIHKNLPYSDPEENLSAGNIQGMQSGAYPTTRTLGFNLNVKF
ncbi:SusC/RagA family TonB-linked outer membrane protein [Terrimonas sp.]|uniref:SusC/RagA family TonB-linked outer membrane protein n=1 Tax=Terrimonas sp. TaxID=1914338 RepID=UPI000D50DEFD|nr:SusC/RagA family TonB-linked outer membrane protein [Terrimonas sp.]PVD52108.1 SusC/RagA family TonB-linked outer membrane protein [Terrimonas sp.]